MQERSERIVPILDRPEVREQMDRVRGRLGQLDTEVRHLVREQPLVAVGVALGIGYALGRLLARR
jgi:ElaB/YqjD/DUF883 family membrane-anchored ribosome-binding protein